MIHMSGINIAETQWTQALSSLSKFSIFAQKYRLNSNINISISENQKIGQKSRRGSFRWTTWWNSSQGWPWGIFSPLIQIRILDMMTDRPMSEGIHPQATNIDNKRQHWCVIIIRYSSEYKQIQIQAPISISLCHNYPIFIWIQTHL